MIYGLKPNPKLLNENDGTLQPEQVTSSLDQLYALRSSALNGVLSHFPSRISRRSPRLGGEKSTDTADAACAGRESSRERAPARRSRRRRARFPCRNRSGERCRICGDRDTT